MDAERAPPSPPPSPDGSGSCSSVRDKAQAKVAQVRAAQLSPVRLAAGNVGNSAVKTPPAFPSSWAQLLKAAAPSSRSSFSKDALEIMANAQRRAKGKVIVPAERLLQVRDGFRSALIGKFIGSASPPSYYSS